MKIAAIRSHRLYKPIMLGIALLIFIIALVNSYYINRENYIDNKTDSSVSVIREAAAKQLNKNPDELTDEDYVKITKLDFDRLMLTDIKFLSKFTNLKELRLSSIRIPKTKKETTRWSIFLAKLGIDYKPIEELVIDLSPLKKLKKLEILNINGTRIKNLQPLAGLINLKELYLSQTVSQSQTQIRDLKQLRRLVNLEFLSLEGNVISDLTPLKEMHNLKVLNLGRTQIKEFQLLRQLSGFKNLQVLYLDNTKINNLEPIANLTSLQRLVLNDNPISSLEHLKGLINLRELVLLDTLVTDIEPVKNLSKLTWIGLPKNITDKQIEDLKKALPNLNEEDSAETVRKAKYNDVAEYIKLRGIRTQVEYGKTREVITKDKLPILYELLDNDEYALYWHKVVGAIGFVSDNPNSVNVLLKFIQRNDNKKVGEDSVMGKSWAFAMIGLIGGDTADSVLRKSVTIEGAREFTKDWIDEKQLPLPPSVGNEWLITMILQHSLDGLVFSGKPENHALVEKIYNEEKEISIKNHERTELMSALISAMARKDYIANIGLETYLNRDTSTFDRGISPYIEKYRFDLNEADSANAVRKAKYIEVTDFIKQNGQLGEVRYGKTREVITKDKLPILYELLDNDEYAPYWQKVVKAIGYVSDDPDSVNVLLKFIQRNDNRKLDRFSYRSKSAAFSMIGLIGGDTADSILRKSITKEGAKELTKEWINEEILPGTVDTERMMRLIQQSSLVGLLYSSYRGKPENLALIEKKYNEEKEASIKNHEFTELMYVLIDVMVAKDRITEVGLETFLQMGTQTLKVLSPYLEKYSFDLNEADSAAK